MLHRKSRIKNHLRSAEKRLTARRELLNACRELLTANGVNVDIIEKK